MTIKFGQTVHYSLIKLPTIVPRTASGESLDALDMHQFILQIASVTPSYQEGNFTAGTTGASGATGTIEFRLVSNLCFLTIPTAITGTGSTTGFTITGLPSLIQPGNSPTIVAPLCEDNNVVTNITNATFSGSTIVFGKALTGGTTSWTAANTKGLLAQTLVYPLN